MHQYENLQRFPAWSTNDSGATRRNKRQNMPKAARETLRATSALLGGGLRKLRHLRSLHNELIV
jgi:hypothetical protein